MQNSPLYHGSCRVNSRRRYLPGRRYVLLLLNQQQDIAEAVPVHLLRGHHGREVIGEPERTQVRLRR